MYGWFVVVPGCYVVVIQERYGYITNPIFILPGCTYLNVYTVCNPAVMYVWYEKC